ncbi:MAG: phosphotransferase [Oscillatoriales cyanobacterium SM2_1_8]|nr:phosphotransferase [Oscillatoriales cyanobacterium SM2_1_8]
MDPEKQKQIIGYFLEEALEHVETIEKGLLDIETMVADPEMVNEVFRAAHSIKGGAGMLGFSSIQHTAHRFEDYFKVLREDPSFKIDETAQSLFLSALDGLKELLEQLQSEEGLSESTATVITERLQPVFAKLQAHLGFAGDREAAPAVDNRKEMMTVFQKEVPLRLREMLELFKQADTATGRQKLQGLCEDLRKIGARFNLSAWQELLGALQEAVGNPSYTYKAIAPLAIKEIKQAQELVLAQRASEIAVPSALRKTAPVAVSKSNGKTDNWLAFVEQVGWRVMDSWVGDSGLRYNVDAPVGHLPAPMWLASWTQVQDGEGRALEKEYGTWRQKLSDCGL